jgi:hypothetical protein
MAYVQSDYRMTLLRASQREYIQYMYVFMHK